ncbi:hypothetical protein [Streptomyces prasinus]|uniref:hypothetical protein n=1 Tax=Streptomyces prasinus TaxID=67345 RepID=UPI003675F932
MPPGAGVSGGEVSGVDLARVAPRAAMEAARKNGGGQKTERQQPRPVRTVRRDGREPMGLGAAIGALVTERGGAPGRRPGRRRGAWRRPASSIGTSPQLT